MENTLYYIDLFDLYGELLTDKQKQYFKDYYFDDLSLGEMSENYGVSRNAIHKQMKDSLAKLFVYEEKLHLYEKRKIIYDIIDTIKDREVKEKIKEIL